MAIQERKEMLVNFKKQTQIKAQVGVLLFNKAPTEISMQYSDYSNVFLTEYTTELLKNTGMNKYIIKLEECKQPLFGPIYSLRSVELEILKTYINFSRANGFI